MHHKFAQHNHAQRRQSHQSSVTVATPLVEHRHPTVQLAIELLADGQLPPCVRGTMWGVSTLVLTLADAMAFYQVAPQEELRMSAMVHRLTGLFD